MTTLNKKWLDLGGFRIGNLLVATNIDMVTTDPYIRFPFDFRVSLRNWGVKEFWNDWGAIDGSIRLFTFCINFDYRIGKRCRNIVPAFYRDRFNKA